MIGLKQHRGATCNCFTNPNRGFEEHEKEIDNKGYRRKLINDWFNKAYEMRNTKRESPYEPFVYAWLSVNAWASCATRQDRDSKHLEFLINDASLSKEFSNLAENDQTFDELTKRFASHWPIFKVSELRSLNNTEGMERAEKREYYFSNSESPLSYQPNCWKQHVEKNERVPVDWPHTISAIYRIRCNLFHGEKEKDSTDDQEIVWVAFQVLVNFFARTKYGPSLAGTSP